MKIAIFIFFLGTFYEHSLICIWFLYGGRLPWLMYIEPILRPWAKPWQCAMCNTIQHPCMLPGEIESTVESMGSSSGHTQCTSSNASQCAILLKVSSSRPPQIHPRILALIVTIWTKKEVTSYSVAVNHVNHQLSSETSELPFDSFFFPFTR